MDSRPRTRIQFAMTPQDPTTDYRKYPKGPNFLLIVIVSSVILLFLLVAAVFLVRERGTKLDPHKPTPTPNALLGPLTPGSVQPKVC